MTFKRFAGLTALAVAGSMMLASCADSGNNNSDGSGEPTPDPKLTGEISGAGASSMGAGQTVWIAKFGELYGDVTVAYDPTGSGGGRTAFKEGGVAFAGTDRALKVDELSGNALCVAGTKAIDLPIWISPIAVVFNLDGIENINMDAATIAKVFAGDITKWNDPAIVAQNAGVSLPDLNITRVVRADKSGTTDNFTDYLVKSAPSAWPADASFEVWEADWAATAEKADGTSGVIEAVKGGNGTIGYADASRATGLGTVAVKVGEEYVKYTPEAAAKVVDASPLAEGRDANDIVIELARDTTESGVYPIVLISYAAACQEYTDAKTGELVKAYLGYVASPEGQKAAAEKAGNAPLSPAMTEKVVAVINAIK